MLNVIVELVDFIVKAVIHYAKTPDGQAEFQQVWDTAHSEGVPVNEVYQQMGGQQSQAGQQSTPQSQSGSQQSTAQSKDEVRQQAGMD